MSYTKKAKIERYKTLCEMTFGTMSEDNWNEYWQLSEDLKKELRFDEP